jgi:hypothetical protein
VTSASSGDGVKVQHKGRFEVYGSDASASSEARHAPAPCAVVAPAAAAPASDAVRLRDCPVPPQSTKVRKGRFVVEEVAGDGDGVRAT